MNKALVATVLSLVFACSCGHSSRTTNDPDPLEPIIEYELDVLLSMNLMPGDTAAFRGLEARICLEKSDSSEFPPVTEFVWMKAVSGASLWLYVFTDADTSFGSSIKMCHTADGGPFWPENALVDVEIMIIDSLGDSLSFESKQERISVSY